MEQFSKLVADLGYRLGKEEIGKLGEMIVEDGKVHLRKMTLIPMWEKCESEIMDIMNKSILQLVSSSKSFFKQ
jgi:hypothetical protein